jgi:PAS domain S-box-containing protein
VGIALLASAVGVAAGALLDWLLDGHSPLRASLVFVAVTGLTVGLIELLRRRRGREPDLPPPLSEERLLDAAFYCIADGVTVQDASGGLLMANEAAARALGFGGAEELLRAPLDEVMGRFVVMDESRRPLSPDELPGCRALRDGDVTKAVLGYRPLPEGEERWSLTTSSPLRDASGRVHAVVNVFQDITERRRNVDRLEALAEAGVALGSSLDYKATLAAVARLAVPRLADWCIVHIVDAGGAVVPLAVAHRDPEKERWAREMQTRYPVRPDDPHGVAVVLRTGGARLVREVTEEMLQAGAQDAEHLALLREAGLRSYIGVPLTAQGRAVGMLSLVTTTESGRFYDDTDLATAELLGRRAGLAIENARLFGEAQEANRLKDEFLATLSHELRTPLNAIVGWTEVLRQDIGDAGVVGRAAQSIHRNAQAQAQLVSDLLDVSRITSGKLRLNVGPVELARVVQAALDTVRPAAEAKGIEMQAVLDLNANEISGDPDRLQQVVWNLLSNAVKFTPKGGRVQVRVEAVESHVEIVVDDNGPGIDPAFLPRVFDRFRQQDASSTRVHQGLGLGLAIVRHLVEMHGGTVTAQNKEGQTGALFTVSLPRRSVAVSTGDAPARRRPSAGGEVPMVDLPSLAGIRVMVVDDNEDARELVCAVLEHQGATVMSMASAVDVLEILPAAPPHVLMADIEMPGEDGYSLIRRVRDLPADQGGAIPAVALTAYASSQDRVNALLAGYSAHLSKPVPAAELVAVVARLAAMGKRR